MNKDWVYIDYWSKKIRAIKHLGGKCKKCGNNNIFHLSFHHKNENDKEITINEIKSLRWSKIKKEIEKCDLLCENCHQELHESDNIIDYRFRKNKQIFLEYKQQKCDCCGYDKSPASLCFHHIKQDNKLFCVSRIKKGIKNILELDNYIKEEIDKCVVLCHNCHTEKHTDIDKFNKLKEKIYYKVDNYKEKQPKINREEVYEMYENGMKQIEIAKHFNASKGTISGIIKTKNS